jgi:hypothetical protein
MKYGMTWYDMDSHAPYVAVYFEKAASGDRRRMSGTHPAETAPVH